MGFRIAIGNCSCAQPYADEIQRLACEAIQAQLREWRPRLPADLSAIPVQAFEHRRVDGLALTLGVYRGTVDGAGSLIVFQVFVHTWSKPTFLALGRVGRMYAEGLVVSPQGDVSSAPDEIMWEFR